jgi:hypothetical protein
VVPAIAPPESPDDSPEHLAHPAVASAHSSTTARPARAALLSPEVSCAELAACEALGCGGLRSFALLALGAQAATLERSPP